MLGMALMVVVLVLGARFFILFGQGTVLRGRTPPSPIQEGPFPQSSCPPRGESKAIIGLKPAILVPSGYPPPPMYWTLYKAFKKTPTCSMDPMVSLNKVLLYGCCVLE